MKELLKSPIGKWAVILIILITAWCCIEFGTTNTYIVKVNSIQAQQEVNNTNNKISTSYKYLIGTDKGVFEITPTGLMASKSFGSIKEDSTYTIFTRGIEVSLVGIYPFIIEAEPTN